MPARDGLSPSAFLRHLGKAQRGKQLWRDAARQWDMAGLIPVLLVQKVDRCPGLPAPADRDIQYAGAAEREDQCMVVKGIDDVLALIANIAPPLVDDLLHPGRVGNGLAPAPGVGRGLVGGDGL